MIEDVNSRSVLRYSTDIIELSGPSVLLGSYIICKTDFRSNLRRMRDVAFSIFLTKRSNKKF